MGLLTSREPPATTAGIGRQHRVLAEVHYSDGRDNWWEHGELNVQEIGTVEALWDPETRSYEFRPETAQGPGPSQWASLGDSTAEPRPGSRRIRMVHRLYHFASLAKGDRRYLHTVDLDLIGSAPQVPYTETTKGAKRFATIMMAAFGGMEILTLSLLFSIVGAAASPGAVPNVSSGLLSQVVEAVGVPVTFLATYWWMARRTRVLSIFVRPVATRIGSAKSELVYLTNSSKEPAVDYLRRIFSLPAAALEADAKVVSMSNTETIERLQEELGIRTGQLDSYKLAGERNWEQGADMAILSSGPGVLHRTNWTLMGLLLVAVAVLAAAATYAVLLAGA